ncbi:MAG: hypothetical protein QM755_15790 [Luteolibacter sp.]
MATSRSLPAKLLLWLAVLLMGIAQCLPWDHIPLKAQIYYQNSEPTAWVSNTSLISPMLHRWTVYTRPHSDERTIHSVQFRMIDSYTVSAQLPPQEVPVYFLRDLWDFSLDQAHNHRSFTSLLASPWPEVLLIIWPVAFLVMLAMPFLTRPLGHSRATLWVVRILALTMLIWLIRCHSLPWGRLPDAAAYSRIGIGCWLTLTALVVEIMGLFLIPNLLRESFPKASDG